MRCREKQGWRGWGSVFFVYLLCLRWRPGYTATQLSRIIIKLGQWIQVTEWQIPPQYEKKLPEDKNFQTVAQTSK